MNKLSITLLAIALPITSPAMADDVTAEVTAGSDSNPFRFSDAYSPTSAFFVDTSLDVSHRFESGFGVKGGWEQRFYESKSSDADNRTFDFGISYLNKGTLFGQDTRFRASATYDDYDKTFYSRSTGQIGAYGAGLTPDRYDASWFTGDVGLEFRFNKKFRLDISAQGKTKDYDDYTILGATDLDFDQWSSRVKAIFIPSKGNRLEASYRFQRKDFKNRLGRDLLGNLVAGTALVEDYHIFEASFDHDISKKQEISVFGRLENRSDNVSGYYNTTNKRIGGQYTNEISENQELEASITYYDDAYDNVIDFGPIVGTEPINSKKGFAYELSYAHRLPIANSVNWWIVVKGIHEDYDSVNDFYIYKRTQLHAGLRLGF